MREIKFRGISLESNNFIYGVPIISGIHAFIVTPNNRACDLGSRVEPETVGQYTGLKDKNGTKIFEGDILRISIKDSDDKIEYKLGVVEFSTRSLEYIIRSKEGLVYGFNSILNSAGLYEFRLEVIGNIYKNRNLLK